VDAGLQSPKVPKKPRSPGNAGTGRSEVRRLPDPRSLNAALSVRGHVTSRRRLLRGSLTLAAAAAILPFAACTNSSEPRPGPGTPVPGAKRYDLNAVTESFEASIKAKETQGISLNAVKSGNVIYRRAFGSLAIGQLKPIGDAASMPSAMVLLALADAGKLSLDGRAAKFIPAFKGDHAAITVRQLLTHTSGLPDDAPVLHDNSSTLEKAAETIAALPLESAPGTAFRYGAVSYQVAGRVAEVAGGKHWDDLFHDYVAGPTGLTGFTYGKTRNPRILDGAQSSPDDYARLLDVQLHDGLFSTRRVLSKASIQLMQSNQVEGSPVEGGPPMPSKGYAIGWDIEAVDDSGVPQRLVAAGNSGAYAWLDIKDAYGACLIIDGRFEAAQGIAARIQPLIANALSRPTE
jgi:CubicO group peptidase (beta-lactamase class C family)